MLLGFHGMIHPPSHKHQVTRFMVHEASPDLFGSRQNKGTLPWLWELVGIVGCELQYT
jgi:hypothetical protein